MRNILIRNYLKPLAAIHESEAFSIKYDGIGILKIYGLWKLCIRFPVTSSNRHFIFWVTSYQREKWPLHTRHFILMHFISKSLHTSALHTKATSYQSLHTDCHFILWVTSYRSHFIPMHFIPRSLHTEFTSYQALHTEVTSYQCTAYQCTSY